MCDKENVKGITLVCVCGDDQAYAANLTKEQTLELIKCAQSFGNIVLNDNPLVSKGRILVTKDDHTGFTLEGLLKHICTELSVRTADLQKTLEEETDSNKRGILLETIANTDNIIELLGEAYEIQENTVKELKKHNSSKELCI